MATKPTFIFDCCQPTSLVNFIMYRVTKMSISVLCILFSSINILISSYFWALPISMHVTHDVYIDVHMMYTWCTHDVHMMYTFYTRVLFMYTWCVHWCTHHVHMMYTFYTRVLFMYTWCTHHVHMTAPY